MARTWAEDIADYSRRKEAEQIAKGHAEILALVNSEEHVTEKKVNDIIEASQVRIIKMYAY